MDIGIIWMQGQYAKREKTASIRADKGTNSENHRKRIKQKIKKQGKGGFGKKGKKEEY
jgi:hypothetical protein